MRFLNLRAIRLALMGILTIAASGAPAQTDPLTTFTLIDLGPGAKVSTDANGNGIVIAGNGQTAYPFQSVQDTVFSQEQSQGLSLPLISQSSNLIDSYLTSVMTDGQGTYAAIDKEIFVEMPGNPSYADVYYVTKNPDGTWNSPHDMWPGGPADYQSFASITGMNRLGEVLGMGALLNGQYGLSIPYLYTIKTGSLLDLRSLSVWASANGWAGDPRAIALDAQGRILLDAQGALGNETPGPDHIILLTPEGVSSDPVAAPEPGALALPTLTIAALALRRAARGLRRD